MQKNPKTAYSLIELSIVILIISILITGALSVSVRSINNAKIKVTRDRMAEIYKAMGTFLIANNRLPCPASLNLDKSNMSYGNPTGTNGTCTVANGVIASTTATNLVYGAVPTKALGLSSEMAEDGFGSKFSYVIHKGFTTTIAATTGLHTTTAPYAPTAPIIQIKENPAATSSTQHAIFALISHGANKAGAYNANAITQNVASADTDEIDNALPTLTTSTTANFNDTFISVSSNSDSFDDIVFYKTRNQMIQDFDAMSVIPCSTTPFTDADARTYTPSSAATYGQIVSATFPSNVNCVGAHDFWNHGAALPQVKCGIFGKWHVAVQCY